MPLGIIFQISRFPLLPLTPIKHTVYLRMIQDEVLYWTKQFITLRGVSDHVDFKTINYSRKSIVDIKNQAMGVLISNSSERNMSLIILYHFHSSAKEMPVID